jgi:hypothetical protein
LAQYLEMRLRINIFRARTCRSRAKDAACRIEMEVSPRPCKSTLIVEGIVSKLTSRSKAALHVLDFASLHRMSILLYAKISVDKPCIKKGVTGQAASLTLLRENVVAGSERGQHRSGHAKPICTKRPRESLPSGSLALYSRGSSEAASWAFRPT